MVNVKVEVKFLSKWVVGLFVSLMTLMWFSSHSALLDLRSKRFDGINRKNFK